MATVYMFGPDGEPRDELVVQELSVSAYQTNALSYNEPNILVKGTNIYPLLRLLKDGQFEYTFQGTDVRIVYFPNGPTSSITTTGFYWSIVSNGIYSPLYGSNWNAVRIYENGLTILTVDSAGHYSVSSYYEGSTYEYTMDSWPNWNGAIRSIVENSTSPKWEGKGGGAGGPTEKPEAIGGNGNQDNTSDVISAPEFSVDPTSPNYVQGVSSTGLVAMYSPTREQLQEFADFLWSNSIGDAFVKMNISPLDNIVAFNLFPFDIYNSGPAQLKFGGIISETIEMNYVPVQFETIDAGSISIEEYWGNFLDYSPFTKVSIFLPYIGFQDLDADDVMGSTINLKYNVDLLSGSCVANLYVRKGDVNDGGIDAPLYSFSGIIGSQIPITSQERGSQIMAAATSMIAVGAIVAGAGVAGAAAATALPTYSTTGALVGGSTVAGGSAAAGALTSSVGKAAPALAAGALATMAQKTQYGRSGNISSNSGALASQYPYIVISRPVQSLAENYMVYNGYPANYTDTLSNLSGFTVVDAIHLENVPATEEEVAEIEKLLRGGVIL